MVELSFSLASARFERAARGCVGENEKATSGRYGVSAEWGDTRHCGPGWLCCFGFCKQ
jgi:hypothetical protein